MSDDDLDELTELWQRAMGWGSEGLEDSEQLSCDSCGKKFKSRNKLFNHLKEFPDHALESSSKGKNYLEEGALDAGDAVLVEQIKAKYRAPDYRAPEFDNSVQTKLEIAVITLCLLGLVGLYLFKELDNTSIFLWGLIFSFMVFLMLFARKWSYEMGVTHTIKHTLTGGPILIIAVLLIFVGIEAGGPGYWDADPIVLPYGEMVLPCWSALIIFLVPPIVHMVKDEEERAERIEIRNRKKNAVKERVEKWSKAQEYETDDRFDAATRIWSKLGEEGEVERVTRLKTEYLCVVLKRKIKDLTEMGADCTQLEEQLAVIETALAESASSKSSIGTESEE